MSFISSREVFTLLGQAGLRCAKMFSFCQKGEAKLNREMFSKLRRQVEKEDTFTNIGTHLPPWLEANSYPSAFLFRSESTAVRVVDSPLFDFLEVSSMKS